jgi:hypothetical protein
MRLIGLKAPGELEVKTMVTRILPIGLYGRTVLLWDRKERGKVSVGDIV